jgi:hypothetical protein
MPNDLIDVAREWRDVIELAATVAIAFFAFASWRVSRQLSWFTGAMETHSDLLMKMEARRQKIPMIWWDPTIEPFPSTAEHGKPVRLRKIWSGMPPRRRRYKGWKGRLMKWWHQWCARSK